MAAVRAAISLGDPGEIDQITVSRIDEAFERCELLILFDPDDEASALAELDRLQDELTHG